MMTIYTLRQYDEKEDMPPVDGMLATARTADPDCECEFCWQALKAVQ